MTRLYADEDFPLPVVDALRQMGHDVLTAQQSGKANQSIPDSAVLVYATEQGRVLLTLNRRDFVQLHLANAHHAGLVVCRADLDFPALAQRIDAALRSLTRHDGQLLRVNRPPK